VSLAISEADRARRTKVENVNIGKTCVTVAASKNDHLVSNQIGRVITFLLGQVASRSPFLPCETRRIRDVQRPHVVERRLSIPASKHDKVVAIEDGGVRAARWGYGTARHRGARETASDRVKCPDVVAVGGAIAATKDVELVADERRGMSTKRRHGLACGVQGGPFLQQFLLSTPPRNQIRSPTRVPVWARSGWLGGVP
jgi:hypothetical protein